MPGARQHQARWRHALLIGPTGMWRAAALEIMRQCVEVTLVARTEASLRAMASAVPTAITHLAAVDYRNARFDRVLAAAQSRAALELVVCWVHGDPRHVYEQLAATLQAQPTSCVVVEIVGSAHADPLRPRPCALSASLNTPAHPWLVYRRAVLGFQLEGAGSRWLTHAEISHGVLAALSDGAPTTTVVGVVRPWARRP